MNYCDEVFDTLYCLINELITYLVILHVDLRYLLYFEGNLTHFDAVRPRPKNIQQKILDERIHA